MGGFPPVWSLLSVLAKQFFRSRCRFRIPCSNFGFASCRNHIKEDIQNNRCYTAGDNAVAR